MWDRPSRRADGVILPREKAARAGLLLALRQVRGGPDLLPHARGAGIFPLDAQVNLPERCYSYFLQEWMTVFEVEHPFQGECGLVRAAL